MAQGYKASTETQTTPTSLYLGAPKWLSKQHCKKPGFYFGNKQMGLYIIIIVMFDLIIFDTWMDMTSF